MRNICNLNEIDNTQYNINNIRYKLNRIIPNRNYMTLHLRCVNQFIFQQHVTIQYSLCIWYIIQQGKGVIY